MTNTSSNPSRVPNLYICRIRQNIPASGLWIYLPTQSREPNFCNGCSKIAQKLINQLWSGFFTSYGIFFASWPSTNRIHKNLSYLEHFSLKSNLSKTKLVERSDWTIFLFHNSGNMYDSYVHLHWVLKKSYFCT